MRVRLEIVPHGDEGRVREIGRLDIFNKGHLEHAPGICEYGVIELTTRSAGLHDASVYHLRNEGAWKLVRNALEDLDISGPMD